MFLREKENNIQVLMGYDVSLGDLKANVPAFELGPFLTGAIGKFKNTSINAFDVIAAATGIRTSVLYNEEDADPNADKLIPIVEQGKKPDLKRFYYLNEEGLGQLSADLSQNLGTSVSITPCFDEISRFKQMKKLINANFYARWIPYINEISILPIYLFLLSIFISSSSLAMLGFGIAAVSTLFTIKSLPYSNGQLSIRANSILMTLNRENAATYYQKKKKIHSIYLIVLVFGFLCFLSFTIVDFVQLQNAAAVSIGSFWG